MQRPKIDLATAEKIRALIERCREKGRDPIRAMDELGYLNFEALEQAHTRSTLTVAATMLDMASVDNLSRILDATRPMTAHEAKQLIVSWLHHLARQQTIQPTEEKQ